MNIMWYIVLGLICYIGVVMLIDFLVAKFRKPKDDYFEGSIKGGDYNEEDFKKKLS